MFCTKCGKELRDGDNFCAYCGSKAREITTPESNMGKYSEVVFNPPFKIEAQRRTEEISREVNKYSQEPKRESLQFDWNLDGFPSSKRKEEDDFRFNWDDVIERKRNSREVAVEKILFAAEEDKEEEKQQEIVAEAVKEDKEERKEELPKEESFIEKSGKNSQTLSIEELERELFGEAPDTDDKGEDDLAMTRRYEAPKEKFYTYNAKRDAFQELLDKERQRVQQMEAERKEQWEELARDLKDRKPKEAPTFEEIFKEPKLFTSNMLREVAVVLPPLTATVIADEEEPATEVAEVILAEDSAEELPPFQEELAGKNKTKLRFSDVFPREDFDVDDGSDNDDSDASGEEKERPILRDKESEAVKDEVPEVEEVKPEETKTEETKSEEVVGEKEKAEEEGDPEKKKNPILKAIIAVLTVLVIIEVAIIGIKLVAPNSGFSKAVDGLVANITSVLTGDDSEAAFISDYIGNVSGSVANIGKIEESADLKYEIMTTFAFTEVAESEVFANDVWIENSDGSVITYGQGIVEGLITYYDQLKTNDKLAEGLVGINKLEIGEIRTGGTGYYVLCKVTYEGEDGEVAKYETAYLEAGAQLINVKEVKEETL